jgi:hypothetical protein
MPQPFLREPAAPEESDTVQADLFADDPDYDWQSIEQDDIDYADPDEVAVVEADPAELEANMMSNLEAVASAFWMESGPELAPLDDSDEPAETNDWPVAAPSLDPENDSWDFRQKQNDDLVGPRRGALLDFRPPRARRERPARTAKPAKKEGAGKQQAPRGGAFADDLAARNKEFYELLKAPALPPRKISVAPPDAPPVRAGRRSFFAADPEDRPDGYVPQARASRAGFGRQAVTLGIIVLVIGAGAALIVTRSGGVAAPSSAAAASLSEEASGVSTASKDESGVTSTDAVPKVVKTERISTTNVASTAPAPAPVDPGTLATPPLYEPPKAPDSADGASTTKANPLASLDLRPTDADASALGDTTASVGTVKTKTVSTTKVTSEPVIAPAADEPVADDESAPSTAASDTPKAEKPAKKVASAEPRRDAPAKPLRGATGSAIVNQAVKMRSGPDNDASVVKVVPTGARVDIVACKGWCEVIAGGDRGYIFQRFLNRSSAPQASADDPAAKVVKASTETDDHQPFDLLRLVRPAD